jgi:predicted nuclease with TOPRIM domain
LGDIDGDYEPPTGDEMNIMHLSQQVKELKKEKADFEERLHELTMASSYFKQNYEKLDKAIKEARSICNSHIEIKNNDPNYTDLGIRVSERILEALRIEEDWG